MPAVIIRCYSDIADLRVGLAALGPLRLEHPPISPSWAHLCRRRDRYCPFESIRGSVGGNHVSDSASHEMDCTCSDALWQLAIVRSPILWSILQGNSYPGVGSKSHLPMACDKAGNLC